MKRQQIGNCSVHLGENVRTQPRLLLFPLLLLFLLLLPLLLLRVALQHIEHPDNIEKQYGKVVKGLYPGTSYLYDLLGELLNIFLPQFPYLGHAKVIA